METIISRNPSTGATLATLDKTPVEIIPTLLAKAREAQKKWALISPKDRYQYFVNAREYILDHLEEIAELICKENGKPKLEAIVNDILPTLELMTHYGKSAADLLKDKPIHMRVMKHKKSYLQYWPKGVIAVIAPWNYPFSIPMGEIVLAMLAGNAVLFKPSEITPLIGMKIFEIFEQACFPKDLIQVIMGDGAQGSALVKSKVDKIFFTGSVATGKRVMASASENLTPVILELGGKDPMVVLEDADLDFATSAALWGGFSNSGQACASVERIIIHENIHDKFVFLLKEKLAKLHHGAKPGEGDLGVATYEKQKAIYEDQLKELNPSTSTVVTGGKFSSDKTYLEPTIITNPPNSHSCPLENMKVYTDETFGPVVAITTFKTISEAVEKANHNNYGLLASVIAKNTAVAETVARQIEAGSVLINEVIYTHGLSETPWGGLKDSGFGKVHSDSGFYEFLNVRHIHKEAWWAPRFKSLWWFPYTEHQLGMFKYFMGFMFRKSWTQRLKNLPPMISEFIQMIKKEKRL